MVKTAGCLGCPLYDDGNGFVPDEIVASAKVDVWLQNPGETEENRARPAVGSTGDDLNDKFLPAAGLTRGQDVSVRNVLRCRWRHPGTGKKTNNLPSGKVLEQAIKHCRTYDAATGATVSIAAGALAWRMFGGPGTITDWRGFPHPDKPVLATLHPADLYRNPKMKLAVLQDWAKVPLYQAGKWPEQVPPFDVVENPQGVARHVKKWCDEAIAKAEYVVLDTEFVRETKYLLTLGLGYSGMGRGLQLWFRHLDSVSRSAIRNSLLALCKRIPIVFQNAMADIPVLESSMGIRYDDYAQIEDTMLAHAVLWSEWPHTLEYLASIYGKYPKMKHLSVTNPQLYNWGDVLDTISAWEGIQKELRRDKESERVYREQSLRLVPILLERSKRGLRVHQSAVVAASEDLASRQVWAVGISHAGAGYPINIGSEKQLKHYLYDWKGYPVQTDKEKKVSAGADAIAALRKHVGPIPDLDSEGKEGLGIAEAFRRVVMGGADPILEARTIYAAAQQEKSHFLAPLEGKERVYPSIKIHAQASGRWSITEPPLQQFPGYLQDLLIPDEGEAWVGWDWDQIELRVLAALSGDEPYLTAFAKGWDIHTLNACAIFTLPAPPDPVNSESEANREWRAVCGWTGKEDIRRTFAKRFVYRLNYGGDARTAGDIPGATQLGLTGPKLVLASQRYLGAHPAMAAWRVQVAADARTTKVSRTFMGRRRRLLGEGQGVIREAYNHPMQGAVSDILNLTTVQIAAAAPDACLAYTVHDAAWWAVPITGVDHFKHMVYPIITQAWSIGGRSIAIPAKWKDVRYGVPVDVSKMG